MGQSVSKGVNKVARKVSKQTSTELKLPPIPRRTPIENNATSVVPKVVNQNDFLRGEGIASKDKRDMGQEIYLQYVQQQAGNDNVTAADGKKISVSGNKEMPDDLLKFIQDVGPAKQTVDREFTAPRLLEEENREELEKLESKRSTRRKRVQMPLMENSNFTTEKNTNFAVGTTSSTLPSSDDDFGISNVEFYDLLCQKDTGENDNRAVGFYKKLVSEKEVGEKNSASSKIKSKDKEKNIERLSQALRVLDVPTLRMDLDHQIIGFYPQEVPGPGIKSVSSIPESKVMFVLKDLVGKGINCDTGRITSKLALASATKKDEVC